MRCFKKIIIIMLHLHGIDVTTGQLSNLCLPSNCFPWSRIEDISDSLSITVFLRCSSLFFTLYQALSGQFVLSQRHVLCNISTPRFRSSLPIIFLKFFVTVPKAPVIIDKIMTFSTSLFHISEFHISSQCSILFFPAPFC